MRIVFLIFTALLVLQTPGTDLNARAIRRSASYGEARAKGAEANIRLKVADVYGVAVSNAAVNAWFDMITFQNQTSGKTGSDGICNLKDITRGNSVKLSVSKDGYYKSVVNLCLANMDHPYAVLKGKWQPDPIDVPIVLKKQYSVIEPITHGDVYYLQSTNEWCAFDCVVNDWVEPYGKGKISDVEFMFSWSGEEPMKWKSQEFGVRFLGNPCNGGYLISACIESDFPYSYRAEKNGSYRREFKDSLQRGIRKFGMLDGSKDFVFRIRCETNEFGQITSCHYGRFRQLDYGLERNGKGSLWMRYDYNATSNDANLEFRTN